MKDRAAADQGATSDTLELIYTDQGYTSAEPERTADGGEIRLEAANLPQTHRVLVVLPWRCGVERGHVRLMRFRWPAEDDERFPELIAGLRLAAFAILMRQPIVKLPAESAYRALALLRRWSW